MTDIALLELITKYAHCCAQQRDYLHLGQATDSHAAKELARVYFFEIRDELRRREKTAA